MLDTSLELVQVQLHDHDFAVPRGILTIFLLVDRLAIGTGGFLSQTLDLGEFTPSASVVGPAKHLEGLWFVGHAC